MQVKFFIQTVILDPFDPLVFLFFYFFIVEKISFNVLTHCTTRVIIETKKERKIEALSSLPHSLLYFGQYKGIEKVKRQRSPGQMRERQKYQIQRLKCSFVICVVLEMCLIYCQVVLQFSVSLIQVFVFVFFFIGNLMEGSKI